MNASDKPLSADPGTRLPGTFRALRHRNYRLYFSGQLVSLTGTWVQTAALTWLAYDLTGQSRWPALISAAQVLPMFCLSILGGTMADRWPKRTLIFLSQVSLIGVAIGLSIMVFWKVAGPWSLLGMAVLLGVANAVDTPARMAFVMDLVGRDDLVNAVALNALTFNLARTIGPAISAWLLPWMGPAGCFLVNGLSYVALLAALLSMRLPLSREVEPPSGSGSIWNGLHHLRQNPSLLLVLILAGSMAFFGWPILSLLPAVSDHLFHAGNQGYAWMLSALGAGALMGALSVANFGSSRRRRRLQLGGVVLVSICLIGLAFSRNLAQAVFLAGGTGCGLILFFSTGQAGMQLGASDHNRGRVLGIWLTVLAGSQPLGNLLAGPAADLFGVRIVLLACSMGLVLVAIPVYLFSYFRLGRIP
ncbi:MAG: MFS transporter [Gemmataceae bacterium]